MHKDRHCSSGSQSQGPVGHVEPKQKEKEKKSKILLDWEKLSEKVSPKWTKNELVEGRQICMSQSQRASKRK